MFTINQPDSAALIAAEKIDRISNDMLTTFAGGLASGFATMFLRDDGTPRTKAEVRSILAAFARPADVFAMQAAATAFLLSMAPDALQPEQYTIPFEVVVNQQTGQVTIPE